jgi:hypothetical protein
VPRYDPNWDPENDKDGWTHNHFMHWILESLRRAKIKPPNYSKSWLYTRTPRNPSSFPTDTEGLLYKSIPTLYQSHRRRRSS